MEKVKAVFKNVWPYQNDKLNLPVASVDEALPFYETTMGFKLVSKNDSPVKSAILSRDDIQIGLAENGGDPAQDGCFFEVNNIEAALAELNSNGLKKDLSDIKPQRNGAIAWKVFFVVAPDGLCYCLGENQS
jgi:catechol 2,3-dioxygenase-like lactoylglutathione lyase family enzyme